MSFFKNLLYIIKKDSSKPLSTVKNNVGETNDIRKYKPLPEEVLSFIGIDKAHIVKENENALYYDVPKEYQNHIRNIVFCVNDLILKAASFDKTINPFTFEPTDIIFKDKEYSIICNNKYNFKSIEINKATKVQEDIFTPLGNLKKHPYIIHFHSHKSFSYHKSGSLIISEVFGKILMDKMCKPSRYEIIHWNNGKLHTIIYVKVKDNIVLNRIFLHDENGNKFLKYRKY